MMCVRARKLRNRFGDFVQLPNLFASVSSSGISVGLMSESSLQNDPTSYVSVLSAISCRAVPDFGSGYSRNPVFYTNLADIRLRPLKFCWIWQTFIK